MSFPHSFQQLWKTCGFFCNFTPFFPPVWLFLPLRNALLLWIAKKSRKWKIERKCCFLPIFSDFSTRVFHLAVVCHLLVTREYTQKPSKARFETDFLPLCAFLSTVFPHRGGSQKTQKTDTYLTFRAFPQFPQALLILLFIIYFILSLYIA